MLIESRMKRNIFINIFHGLIPELLFCYIVSIYMDQGVIIFIFLYLGLQAVKFLVWLFHSLWGWLIYIVYGRKNMTRSLTDYLVENIFPDPGGHIDSVDSYLQKVVTDDDVEIHVRLKAAVSIGELAAYKQAGQIQWLLKYRWALEDALIQHRREIIKDKKYQEAVV